jgi:hypothetical protein
MLNMLQDCHYSRNNENQLGAHEGKFILYLALFSVLPVSLLTNQNCTLSLLTLSYMPHGVW